MILLKPGYSTTILFMCLCMFRLVSMQLFPPADATLLSDPSGVFTSPGYPNTEPGETFWNITVDKEHRIILQFLDFEVVERDPCTLDNFELFDGEFSANSQVGRWCWDSFDKLTVTTYTSMSNILLFRFRAVTGFERKGFKANYSSISTKSPTTSALSTTPTTFGFPQSIKTSTRVASVEMTMPKSTKTSNKVGVIAAIATSIIIAIIIILIATLFVRKYKMSNRGENSSKGQLLKSFVIGNISTDEYEVVEKENGGVVESKYENTNPGKREENSTSVTDTSINVQRLSINTKDVVSHHEMDTPDGTYEKPDVYVYSHPDPNEMKFCIKQ